MSFRSDEQCRIEEFLTSLASKNFFSRAFSIAELSVTFEKRG